MHKLLSSLKVRITLMVVLLVLGGLWAFAAVVANRQENRLRELLAAEQAAALSFVAESLDDVVRLRLDALDRTARALPLERLGDREAMVTLLRERPVLHGLFNSGIILAQPDGAGAFADYPPLPGRSDVNFATLDAFQEAVIAGRAVMGKPFRGRFLDTPVITFARPVHSPDGVLVTVIIGIVTLDAPNFLDLVAKRRLGGGDTLVIAPQHGVIVTGSNPDFVLRPLPQSGDEALTAHVRDGFSGTLVMKTPDDGVERLVSIRPIPTAGWAVVSRLPTAEAFAPVRNARSFVFAGAGILSLLIGLGAALLLRRALDPLAVAAERLDAISSGKAPMSRLPVARRDEIGRLMESFNRLQERLQHESSALHESEAHLTRAQAVAHIGSWQMDFVHDEFRGSAETCRLLGMVTGVAMRFDDFIGHAHPDDRTRVLHALREGQPGVVCDMEYRIDLQNGVRWVHLRAEMEHEANGRLIGGTGTLHDVTARRQAEERVKLTASVFENTHEGVSITDPDGIILDVNPAFCEITGYSREEALGRKPGELLRSGRQRPEFYEAMWAAIRSRGFWRSEIWNRRKNGEVFPELLTISAVRDESGRITHFVAVFSDISHLKQHERQLERMAHFDALTGIPNRVLLADRIGQAIAQTQRQGNLMAVCYLDLDNFKPINDTWGHEAGDRLLVEMTERLKSCLRGGDTVARLGGDEFALLLPGLPHIDECEAVLERIVAAIATPCNVGNTEMNLSASIGFTLYPIDDADADALLRHADQAMYEAKQAGRNRYHLFDAEHDRRTRAHHEALGRIERALVDGEFLLHYQPKVDMRAGRVIGAEALLRWQHPERGLLMPGEFLPDAEGTDLMIGIGDWVIETALTQMAQWRAAGLDLPVSVNVAARHLQCKNFLNRLGQLLAAQEGYVPGALELEVLETAAVEETTRISRLIETCRDMGVSFAIDDFGTGYSSLSYFKALPAQTLKIDQSFIRDMLRDPDDLAIVEGVIGLAEIFRRRVVAEGVETVEHGIVLLGLGCDLAQGYGIARPMPATAMADWVRSWRPELAWARAGRRRWAREDVELLVAENDHRQWVDAVTACVTAKAINIAGEPSAATITPEPPPASPNACRFGQWYGAMGRLRYGHLPEFVAVAPLHERVHAVGGEALALAAAGDMQQAAERLDELYALRGTLIDHLHALHSTVECLS